MSSRIELYQQAEKRPIPPRSDVLVALIEKSGAMMRKYENQFLTVGHVWEEAASRGYDHGLWESVNANFPLRAELNQAVADRNYERRGDRVIQDHVLGKTIVKALAAADQIARIENDNQVFPEHLIRVIAATKGTIVHSLLFQHGVNPDKFVTFMPQTIERDAVLPQPYSPRLLDRLRVAREDVVSSRRSTITVLDLFRAVMTVGDDFRHLFNQAPEHITQESFAKAIDEELVYKPVVPEGEEVPIPTQEDAVRISLDDAVSFAVRQNRADAEPGDVLEALYHGESFDVYRIFAAMGINIYKFMRGEHQDPLPALSDEDYIGPTD